MIIFSKLHGGDSTMGQWGQMINEIVIFGVQNTKIDNQKHFRIEIQGKQRVFSLFIWGQGEIKTLHDEN